MASRTFIACLVLSVCASIAHAERPPTPPRLFHVPTAHVQPASRGHGSLGLNHRGGGLFALTYGLGGLADVDIEVTDRFVTADDERPHGTALFKLGLAENHLGFWHPAAALGFRKSFAGQKDEVAELFAAGSASVGPVNLHAGASYWGGLLLDARPFGGFEWQPGMYPKTTLLADLSWAQNLGGGDSTPRWIGGWGVRYQAVSWGSIELGVRHREQRELSDATVFVRLNGVRDFR